MRLDGLDKLLSERARGGHPATPQEIEELKKQLAALRKELFLQKDDAEKRAKAQDVEIARKASRDELTEMEKRLTQKDDELAEALAKLKAKMEKALKQLEDRLRRLSDKFALVGRSPSPDNAEDAMFARKPIEGWSCASCEKNLINLQGLPAEYYPWKKMPRKGEDRVPMVCVISFLPVLAGWSRIFKNAADNAPRHD